MKDCPACGFEFEEEPQVCPKCEHLIREKSQPVPSVKYLQDLSEEQLREVAETHGISGFRRLSYKGLLHALNNQRIEDEESDARRNRIPRLKLEFNEAIDSKNMERAKKLLNNLTQIGADGLDEWKFKFEKEDLLTKLDEVTSTSELPEAAFYFDDDEVKEKLEKVKHFYERRESLILKIENALAPSDIDEEMLYCEDDVVSKLAKSTRLKLVGDKKEKAALAITARKTRRERKDAKAQLKKVATPGGVPKDLLKHEDEVIRNLAMSRLNDLKSRVKMIENIKNAKSPEDVPELALKSDDAELKKLAKEQLKSLLYQEKQELLSRISKSNKLVRLPPKARKHSDSKIRTAYEKRAQHIRSVNKAIKEIEVTFDKSELEEITTNAPVSDLIDKAISLKNEEIEKMPALFRDYQIFYKIALPFLMISVLVFLLLKIFAISGYLAITFVVVYWSKLSINSKREKWIVEFQEEQDQTISEIIDRQIADIDSALMSDLKSGDSVDVDYLGKQYQATVLEVSSSKRVMIRNEDDERIISVPTYALSYSGKDEKKSKKKKKKKKKKKV